MCTCSGNVIVVWVAKKKRCKWKTLSEMTERSTVKFRCSGVCSEADSHFNQMFDNSIVNSLKDEHHPLQQRMSSRSQNGLVLVLMIQCSCFIDCVFLCCSAGWTRPRKSSGRSAVRAVSFSFSTCDQSGRWWVGLCDSVSGSIVPLAHLQIQ